MAKALVFSKVKSSLGLDHCHIFISGAAPLNQETSEFFLSLDIPIGEVYGLSESTGPHSMSTPENYRILRYLPPGRIPAPPATPGQRDEDGGRGGRWASGLRRILTWCLQNDPCSPASKAPIFMAVGSPSLSQSPWTRGRALRMFCGLSPICHLRALSPDCPPQARLLRLQDPSSP